MPYPNRCLGLFLTEFCELIIRHRWTGRYEAHLWDKSTWNQNQNKKGKQGSFRFCSVLFFVSGFNMCKAEIAYVFRFFFFLLFVNWLVGWTTVRDWWRQFTWVSWQCDA